MTEYDSTNSSVTSFGYEVLLNSKDLRETVVGSRTNLRIWDFTRKSRNTKGVISEEPNKMIKLLILVFSSTLARSHDTDCVGIHFREGELYEPIVIKEGITNIRGLTYSGEDNLLYFTFSYLDDVIKSRTAKYNLDENKIKVIEEVNNTNSNLVDDINNVVFIAAFDGIYKLKDGEINKTAVQDNVLSMSIARNDLYYVNSKHEVFGIRNDKIEEVKMLKTANITKIVVNNFGDIVFVNNFHQIGTLKNGETEFRIHQLTAKTVTKDQDVIYVCADTGLYEYSVTGDSFTKIAYLPNLQGLVFTKENIPIYASTGMLVQLNQKICL